MKPLALLVCSLLASTAAMASRPGSDADSDRRGPRTTITVTIAGLSCSTAAGGGSFFAGAWSWGASNTGSSTGGGSGIGRTDFQNLSVTKALDACSPALLGAVSTGRHSPTLVLTQVDPTGNEIARVELDEVLVTSWVVSGAARDATPNESLTFSFRRVRLTSGGASFCWDVVAARAC